MTGLATRHTRIVRPTAVHLGNGTGHGTMLAEALAGFGEQWPDAACRNYDPELWFPDRGGDDSRAREICGRCPRMAQCLAGAIDRAEPDGVWGGENFNPDRRSVALAKVVRSNVKRRPRRNSVG